jgi:predicted phage terminase large subunit-like protein
MKSPAADAYSQQERNEEEAALAALQLAEEYWQAEQSLASFVRQSWDVLEPARPFLSNWHIDLICEYLELAAQGECKRLIINIPPRYMKSTIATICFPVWVWLKDPQKRFIASSYAASLSLKHSMDRRTLIESAWFQKGWRRRFSIRGDQNTKSDFQNNKRGAMLATSVGGSSTGRGGDILLVDDPHDPQQAASDKERVKAIDWFDKTFERRLDDKKKGAIIVVMQRLHEKDLTGHLLSRETGSEWSHLKLPAEAPSSTRIVFPRSGRVLDRQEGDVLWPERETQAQLDRAKITMQGDYEAQLNQDPVTKKGGFFPRSWWPRYKELPAQFEQTIMLMDCASEPGITNDYSAAGIVGITRNGIYWKHVERHKFGFPELLQWTKDLAAWWKPDALIIERKSAGTQLIQTLEADTLLPIVSFEPGKDSKIIRASAAQPSVKAGNCHLPEQGDWVQDFITEHEKFPNAEHDDQVDLTSMLIIWLRENSGRMPEPRIRVL